MDKPKRVLVVGLKDPAGGVEAAVMNYIRSFDHRKVVCDVAVFADDFSMRSEIEAMGGKVLPIPSRRKDFSGYRAAVGRIFEENPYSALWCNFSGLTNLDIPALAKKAGVSTVIAHSHTAALAWGSPVMKYVVHALHYYNKRKVGRYFTDFWGCSRASAVFMFGKTYGSKAKIIPNAIDTRRFLRNQRVREEIRAAFGIEKDELVIGHVGRMCTAKNQIFLLDAFRAFSAKNQKAKLLFVGDGELKESVCAHASEIGMEQKVIFTGARTDVDRLLWAMDVFFLPSVTEGFPVTLVEAQAASLPCVVSSEAVLRETDLTGHMQFVSLREDMSAWVCALEAAACDRYSDGNETVAASRYDIRRASAQLIDYLI